MPATQSAPRFHSAAVFADLDSLLAAAGRNGVDMAKVMSQIQRFARCDVRRAYGDWSRLDASVLYQCQDLAFDLAQVAGPGAGRSPADVQLAVEALTGLRQRDHIDMVYLVSGSGNLAPLARALRGDGYQVIGIGPRGRVTDAYRFSCDRFLDYDRIVSEEEGEAENRPAGREPSSPAPRREAPRRERSQSPARPPLTELVGQLGEIDVDDDTLESLDKVLDDNGMQFLGADHQDRILHCLFDILAEQQVALNRSEILHELRQELAAQDSELGYDQNVLNGVFHILYRAIVFNLAKRPDSLIACHWLKQDYQRYDAFRRAHDARLIQAALESGLELGAEQWAEILYEDRGKADYIADILSELEGNRS